MTEDEPKRCDTLGCENEPIEDGYCAECADISPGILDSDDTDDTPEGGHRASDVSRDDPESEVTESADSSSHSPIEDGSDDTDPGFEAGVSATQARQAFADAVEWFHAQLDATSPTSG